MVRVFPFFFFNDTATTEIYTLSLHDALPISRAGNRRPHPSLVYKRPLGGSGVPVEFAHYARPERHGDRSEEHTSELQSPDHLVCRLLLEKKKTKLKQYQRRVQACHPHR